MPKIRLHTTQDEINHFNRLEKYSQQVTGIYLAAIKEFAALADSLQIDPSKPFSFSDYPQTKEKVAKLLQRINGDVSGSIRFGMFKSWNNANDHNDTLVDELFQLKTNKKRKAFARYKQPNIEAFNAFRDRKEKGLDLSGRVWKYTQQYRQELEMALGVGIGDGKSAAALARDAQKYLQDTDNLFRRYQDKHGAYHLSKAAEAYHPGRGVYRSSVKNAQRLTRTENNMAYRLSDFTRWQQMDFIVGYEVRVSNRNTHCPLCERLKGKYPKTFKFAGWHPHCRCYMVPIMMTEAEMNKLQEAVLAGEEFVDIDSVNQVRRLPEGFTSWVSENRKKIDASIAKPYFIRDNYKGGDINKGLRIKLDDEKVINFVPAALTDYEKKLEINVDRSIFSLLNRETKITHKDGGAYYIAEKHIVNLPFDDRRKNSKWKAESVVYHEYGHAADWNNGLRDSREVKQLMAKYRKSFAANNDELYKQIDADLWTQGLKHHKSGAHDLKEQTGAAHDTLMSLNSKYGAGHSKEYWKVKGFSEAEFIAHMFENKFAGNSVFKEIMPELYDDMIKLADSIIKRLTKK